MTGLQYNHNRKEIIIGKLRSGFHCRFPMGDRVVGVTTAAVRLASYVLKKLFLATTVPLFTLQDLVVLPTWLYPLNPHPPLSPEIKFFDGEVMGNGSATLHSV